MTSCKWSNNNVKYKYGALQARAQASNLSLRSTRRQNMKNLDQCQRNVTAEEAKDVEIKPVQLAGLQKHADRTQIDHTALVLVGLALGDEEDALCN